MKFHSKFSKLIFIMKYLSFAFILSLFLFHPVFAKEELDRQKDKLIGPVRSISVINCEENQEGQSKALYTTFYDLKGNMTERVYFNENGIKRGSKFTYSYDAQGRLKERITDSNSPVYMKEEYVYSNGNFIKKIYLEKGKSRKTEIYNFNGAIIEEVSYADDGAVLDKVLYAYDDKGNVTEMTVYNTKGSIMSKWRNSYDEEGNITEDFLYDADGALLKRHTYTYDVHGNITRNSYYQSGTLVGEETYKYEYDDHGNWIKKTASGIGPVSTICRSITYY